MANLFNLSQSTKTNISTDPKVKKQPLFDLSSNTKITPSVKAVTGNQQTTDYSKPETIYLESPEERALASSKSNLNQKPSVFNKRKILSKVGNFLLKTNPITAPLADVRALNKSLDPVMQPIIDMTLNTEVGKKVATDTKYARGSSVKAIPEALYKVIGDKINPAVDDKKFTEYYNESINRWKTKGEDPNVTFPEQVARGVVDSGVQSGVGVLLNFVPLIGKPLSAVYFGLVSASEQIENEGEVTSGSKILLDTWGDTMISNTVEGMFKKSVKDLAKVGFVETAKRVVGNIGKGFATEGITEPTQTFGKFAIDYQKAKTPEQRYAIIEQAKEYIKNGGMLMEFLVGGLSGAGITGLASIAQQSQINPNIPKPKLGLTEDDDKEFTPEQNKIRESFREDIKDNLSETGMNKPYVARQLSKETGIDNAVTTLMVDEVAETIEQPATPILNIEDLSKQALNEAGSTLEETKTEETTGNPEALDFTNMGTATGDVVAKSAMIPLKNAQTVLKNAGYSDSAINDIITSLADKVKSSLGRQSIKASDIKEAAFEYSTETKTPEVPTEQPKLKPVYHGTDKVFKNFKDGSFFSTDKNFAKDYGSVGEPSYLDMKNTFDITNKKDFDLIASKNGIEDQYDGKIYKTFEEYKNSPSFGNDTWEITEPYLDKIKSEGYDSARIFEGGIENFTALNKNIIQNKAQGEAKMKISDKNKEDNQNINKGLDTLKTKEDNKEYERGTNNKQNDGEVQPNKRGSIRSDEDVSKPSLSQEGKLPNREGNIRINGRVQSAKLQGDERKSRVTLESYLPEVKSEVIDQILFYNNIINGLGKTLSIKRADTYKGSTNFDAFIQQEGDEVRITVNNADVLKLDIKTINHEGSGHFWYSLLNDNGRKIVFNKIKEQYYANKSLFDGFLAKQYWSMFPDHLIYQIRVATGMNEEEASAVLQETGFIDKENNIIYPENILETSFNFQEKANEINNYIIKLGYNGANVIQEQNTLMADELNAYVSQESEMFEKEATVPEIQSFSENVSNNTLQFKKEGTEIPFGGIMLKLKDSTKLTSADIIKKHANIQLKRDIVITDVYGEKATLKAGEGITPYEVTGNKFILQDGEAYLVSKSQAQNVINNSKTAEAKPFAPELKQTEETIKGEKMRWIYDGEKGVALVNDNGDIVETGLSRQSAEQRVKDNTRYSQYTLPGGENYKEILIKGKTPYDLIDKNTGKSIKEFNNADEARAYLFNKIPQTDRIFYQIQPAKGYGGNFKSSHWDEPNVISHIRMNERTYNGKKVAFMEELQSDWAREARAKGTISENQLTKLPERYEVNTNVDGNTEVTDPNGVIISTNYNPDIAIEEALKQLNGYGKIPNNPLLKNWQELSIKRALQEAVNTNAKYFAWINGPQTEARYNLSKELNSIVWEESNNQKVINLNTKDSGVISLYLNSEGKIIKTSHGKPEWVGKNLEDAIGKGVSEKILASENGKLEGEEMDVKATWAYNLYDKQVRVIVENLTGQKVEMLDMGLPVGDKVKQWASEEWGTHLTYKRMETEGVGLEIRPMEGGEVYVVTDLLGNGKFKAVTKESVVKIPEGDMNQINTDYKGQTFKRIGNTNLAYDNKTFQEQTFDISNKTTQQMGIEITPEVKAIVKGEAPQVKVSGKLPFTEQITAPVMFKIKLPDIRAELNETQRQLDEAVAYPEVYGQELIVELTSKVADLRNQVMQEKYPTFETGNVIEDLRKTLDYTESRVGLAKKMSVKINDNINEAVQQEEDVPKEVKEKTATKAEVLNLYNNSLTEPLIELPDDIKKLQEEFAGKMEVLEYKRDKLASHPGRILSKFISRKEGQFLDFKNPESAKTKSEKKAIIERNKKVMAAAESAFEGTLFTDKYDDPDTIREQIDEYDKLKKEIEVADNEIKQLATRYFNRTNEFYGQETDNLNVLRSFNEFELGLEIEASGEINTGIDNYIYDDITDRAKNSSFQALSNTKYYSRDFFRIMKRFFANSYPLMQQMFITPFENAKGANAKQEIELKNELYEDIVKKFGIKLGSAESRAVMDYGERNLQEEFAPENPETEATLKAKFGAEKTQKIIAADQWFHDKYTKLVDEINVVYKDVYGAIWQKKKNLDSEITLLEENIKEQKIKMSQTPNKNTLKYLSYIRALRRLYGMKQQRIDLTNSEAWWRGKIIPKRNDYYRHYQEVAEGFGALKNILTQESNIPTNLAAISQQTKPKSKFLKFGQKRIGNKSKRDAVGAFLDYVPAATYAIHMTPHIERLRKIAEAITRSDNKIYSPFITYLTKFTNELTGKTALFDRDLQEVSGRKLFRIVDWLNKRVKANVIMGNPRVTLVQLASLPPGIASAKQYIVPGVKRFITDMYKENSPMKKSNFLTERYKDIVDEKFRTGVINSPRKFARIFMRALEKPSVEIIWNSHYEQGVAKNVPNPISYADSKTRNVVAGRGIGEVPLLYNSKAIQLIAPFQLEVGNLWILMGEWKKEKDLSAFAILFILSWLFNRGMEDVTGSDVLPDPIQASIEGIKTFIDEEDKLKGAGLLTGRLGGEILSNIPFGQYAASLYPEYGMSWLGGIPRAELFGKGDPLKYGSGLLSFSGLKDPLFKILPPFGGSQLKKTYEGIDAYLDGKVANKGGDEIYSIPKGEMKLLQMSLFGKYSIKEARDYFNREEVSDKTYKDKLKEWNSGIPKTQENLDELEKEMVQEIYGAKYSTRELTEVSKKFAFYRTFGEKNKLANQILEATDNEERVDILIKTREELGKEEFVKFFNQGRKTVKSGTGSDVPILISDNLKEFYLLKTYLNRKLKDNKIGQDKYDTYLEYYKGGRTTFEKIKEKLD